MEQNWTGKRGARRLNRQATRPRVTAGGKCGGIVFNQQAASIDSSGACVAVVTAERQRTCPVFGQSTRTADAAHDTA